MPCLTAEHEGQLACYTSLCFDSLSMRVTFVAVMPRHLKASEASIHNLPSELLGKVFAGVDVYGR